MSGKLKGKVAVVTEGHSYSPETIVLLHGGATGSKSWRPISSAFSAAGAKVIALDMLGYGSSPPPSSAYDIHEEVVHLTGTLERSEAGDFHLVTHSIGALFGLHLRRSLGLRVTRLTLIEPVVVGVLREAGEETAYAEMEDQYRRFMRLCNDPRAAARVFVDLWSGAGVWDRMSERACEMIASLVPRLRLEMIATRSDNTTSGWFSEAPPPTTILVGEKTLLPPRAVARVLASAFHASTIIVPGGAHMIPITHPNAVVSAVLAEINGLVHVVPGAIANVTQSSAAAR